MDRQVRAGRPSEDMQPMEMRAWNDRNLRVILALDHMLEAAWERAVCLVSQELPIEGADLTIDQQIRFGHAMILAVLELLPEHDLPVAN